MNINGYEIIDSLRTDNSGTAKWGFAVHRGREVFIKEFLTPVYPYQVNDLAQYTIDSSKMICREFEQKKDRLYNSLAQCKGGGVVSATDFFRYCSKYYVVTPKIDMTSLTMNDISHLSRNTRITICKVIAYNMISIHEQGIIHADIKPNNILIKRTQTGGFTAKIIDFDSSFFEDDLPSPDDFQCDTVYLAPEGFMYICEEEERLTTKIDIFALGILFCQYLTGDIPSFSSEYTYLYEAVLDGAGIEINGNISDEVKSLLRSMLAQNPDDRPDIRTTFNILTELTKKTPDTVPGPSVAARRAEDDTAASLPSVTKSKKGFKKAGGSL